MAAPAHTVRQNPDGTGVYLPDGYPSRIAFNLKPQVMFWEIELKPPGVDGGEPINATSMLNLIWRSFNPPVLKTLMPITGSAKYDPDFWADILTLINNNSSITFWWPDGSSLDFYGWLVKIEPQDNKEKELPRVNFTIHPSNYDPVNHIVVGPTFTAGGT